MTQPIRSERPSPLVRKLRKLGNEPKRFFIDSSGFQIAHRSWQQSLKLGSFLWVLACFAIAAIYLGIIASDRYVSRSEIIIKQADQIKMLPDALSMLGIGGSNHQDVLLIQDYLNSWDLLAKLDKAKLMLAGGLNPDNALQAARVGCLGLDFNSGVESAPGRKDAHKLAAAFGALRQL